MKEMIKYKIADIGVYFSARAIFFLYISALPTYCLNEFDSEGRSLYEEGAMTTGFVMTIVGVLLFSFLLFLYYQKYRKFGMGGIFGAITFYYCTAFVFMNIFSTRLLYLIGTISFYILLFVFFIMPVIFVIMQIICIIKFVKNKKKKAAE